MTVEYQSAAGVDVANVRPTSWDSIGADGRERSVGVLASDFPVIHHLEAGSKEGITDETLVAIANKPANLACVAVRVADPILRSVT